MIDCDNGLLALPAASMPQNLLQVGETLPVVIREQNGSIRATLDIAAAKAAISISSK
jgi:hypothetical protein